MIDEIVDTLVLETGTLELEYPNQTRFVVPRTNENISLTIHGKVI